MLHDKTIERLALGELPAETAERLRRDASVREREAAIAASNEEILRAYPPERIAVQIRTRASRAQRARRLSLVVTMGLAALILARILPEDDPTERTKGSPPALSIWRKTRGEPERLASGRSVRAGDVLQIAYGTGLRYGVIASLDGAGEVTVHWPATGDAAAELDRGAQALPSAYELDQAPEFERFVLVASAAPFSVAEVRRALTLTAQGPDHGRSEALRLTDGLLQTSVLLLKEQP
jgi:hypothetical protein